MNCLRKVEEYHAVHAHFGVAMKTISFESLSRIQKLVAACVATIVVLLFTMIANGFLMNFAISNKQYALTSFLLTLGQNVNGQHKIDMDDMDDVECERSFLDISVRNQDIKMVQLLLLKGVDINLKNKDLPCDGGGGTPLITASSGKDTKIVDLLLAHGADVNATNKYEDTPLSFAAYEGNVKTIETLISHGANVNSKNTIQGYTPLHNAANEKVAELLIAHGADVNAKGKNGETPLRLSYSKKQMAESLIVHGADVNAVKDDGSTVLSEATQDVQDILIAHGAIRIDPPKLSWARVDNRTEKEMLRDYKEDQETGQRVLARIEAQQADKARVQQEEMWREQVRRSGGR